MKALITSLALALMFMTGMATAGEGSHGDGEGCHYNKWEDT